MSEGQGRLASSTVCCGHIQSGSTEESVNHSGRELVSQVGGLYSVVQRSAMVRG